MRKLLLGVFISALLFLGACSNEGQHAKATTLYDAEKAADDYKLCASCHGADLQGGKSGAGYAKPITSLTKEHILKSILEGPGVMPKDMVTGEAAENLAAWIAAQ